MMGKFMAVKQPRALRKECRLKVFENRMLRRIFVPKGMRTRSGECLTRSIIVFTSQVGLGGLGVTCSPRDPRFADSNPTEVDGLFRT